jgi:hypothetical protein
LKLEEELRDLHELITTFSATPAVTVSIAATYLRNISGLKFTKI